MNYTFTIGGSEEGGEVSMLAMAKQRHILPKKLLVKHMYIYLFFFFLKKYNILNFSFLQLIFEIFVFNPQKTSHTSMTNRNCRTDRN